MMSFAPRLKRLAAASFCAAVALPLCAAEQELPPSKRNAPKGQHIEFSQPASGPELPKPTAAKDSIEQQRSIAPQFNSDPGLAGGGLTPAMVPMPTPTKAYAERMKQQLDKKKNWLVPGAQEDFLGLSESWASKGLEKTDDLDGSEKNKSVLERFLTSENKAKPDRPDKRRDDKKDKEDNFDPRGGNNNRDNPLDDRTRDPRTESQGISDFNLHGFLSGDRRADGSRKEAEGTSGFQPIHAEIVGDPNRAFRDRERDREREATRAAEFQQMIAPRGGGGARLGAVPDPINSGPDLTRRDFNPIMPRAGIEPARPETSPFNSPSAPGVSRFQDQGMLGVTGPRMPSMGTPSIAPVTPAVNFRPAQSIILEPPKRKFN